MHEKQTETPHTLPASSEEGTQTPCTAETNEYSEKQRRTQIQTLNDIFRTTFVGGEILITHGIQALPEEQMDTLFQKVQSYDHFTQDNDPYGEHDFGNLKLGNKTIFWKIDYYNRDMTGGSEEPSDPSVTQRVLTIMLASEY